VRGLQDRAGESNGDRDHVHLLVNDPPEVALSRLVNSLKGA
jgi:putative transposase